MRLLSGIEDRRLDVELDVLSPDVFTGVYPWTITQKKVDGLNFYPVSISPQFKNSDALLLGNPASNNYLFKGMGVKAYGVSERPYDESNPSNTAGLGSRFTGQLASSHTANRYDACHAWHHYSHFTGNWNFYPAFHPYGYYSPPFGELVSLSEFIDEMGTVGDPVDNGSCAQITNSEYMQMRGITTVSYSAAPLSNVNDPSALLAAKIAPIDSPYEECPPQAQLPYYFEEILFRYGAGTYAGGVVGNPFNHNPIPSSLDYVEMQLSNRYNIINNSGERVIAEQGSSLNGAMTNIANYGTGAFGGKGGINNDLTLNNKLSYRGLCMASDMEGGTSAGVYQGGSLDLRNYDPAAPLNAGSIAPTFNYNPWYYWNFTFKENHDSLPFLNNFNTVANGRSSSRGTQLLWAKKADSDHWWENRQCPEVVDFVPWSFGATVHDCPRDYFEIPYYSAIGKFGYFGTRFQVSCKRLQRNTSNDKDEVKAPIPVFEVPYPMSESENDPDIEVDSGGATSDFYFDGLLEVAKREQNYSEWLVTNKAPKLAHNYSLILSDSDYLSLVSYKPNFSKLLYSLVSSVEATKRNLPNFLTGTNSPYIKVGSSDFEEDYSFLKNNISSSDSNLNYDTFEKFYNASLDLLGGKKSTLDSLLDRYGYFYKTNANSVDWSGYHRLVDAKEERIRTRAFLNISQGNPIDLFPTNHITYSFDSKREYQYSDKWARSAAGSRSSASLNGGLELPTVERRYFEGAYSKTYDRDVLYQKLTDIMSLSLLPSALAQATNQGYSDGAFYANSRCGATLPIGSYFPVTGGNGIKDSENPNSIGLVNNWMLLGYNEIGEVDANFSCFTPIFIQQPKNVYCKLGQSPTFRAYALDYHTIPEDKIKIKHPEIWYWASKLKLVDNQKRYLYPMRYQWGRVRTSNVDNFMKGNFDDSTIQWASTTGEWGFLEGANGPTCTFIHPVECVGLDDSAGYSSSNRDSYKFIQGIKEEDCTNWAYFCLALGRFGVRCSDLFLIEADKFLLLDLAYMNGGGASLSPSMEVKLLSTVDNSAAGGIQEGGAQSFSPSLTTPSNMVGVPFNGIKNDPWVIPEEVVVKQKYMRAGGGQNVAFGFNGDYQFRGFLRSYAPETISDTRGLRSVNHQPIDYGILLNFKLELTDFIGSCLYGYKHLPTCRNSEMADGEMGVRIAVIVDGQEVKHPHASQRAEIPFTNPPAPVTNGRVVHLGQLYNFGSPTTIGVTTSWQFHQNLGAVKRFGKATQYSDKGTDFVFVSDRSAVDPAGSEAAFNYVKDEVCTSSELAGTNCGYTPSSVGRKMLYYVEAFERFYILCDMKAKYNVPNKTFIAPGLRFGDAPMQYAWFGQPSDTYLERYSMYGPYAFQWKVKRHNRDRLGNGISQGLWSMGWREKYSLMYDLPAIYGLYMKNTLQSTKDIVADINTLRNLAFPNQVPPPRNIKLGRGGNQAEGYGYGEIRFDCDTVLGSNSVQGVITSPSTASYAETICAYYSAGSSTLVNSSEYYCGLRHIQNGACFDPCLSIRYSHGFMPGGRFISHLSGGAIENADASGDKKSHKITQNGEDVGSGSTSSANHHAASDDFYVDDKRGTGKTSVVLRGPAFTPYSKGIKKGDLLVATAFSTFSAKLQQVTNNSSPKSNRVTWSINPCEQGGSEHCNFITPTIHIGGNLPLTAFVTSLTSNNNSIVGNIT